MGLSIKGPVTFGQMTMLYILWFRHLVLVVFRWCVVLASFLGPSKVRPRVDICNGFFFFFFFAFSLKVLFDFGVKVC